MTEPAKHPAPRNHKFLLVLILVFAFYPFFDVFLSTHRTELTVTDLSGLPATCQGRFLPVVSSKNAPSSIGRCGSVMTDLGVFGVVASNSLHPFAMSRAKIVATLHSGCRYKIWYAGPGTMPNPVARATNIMRHTILRASPIGPCPA